MILRFPEFTPLSINLKDEFDLLTAPYEPYAEFSFGCLFSWDINSSAALSVIENNLLIKMPDYETGDPFISLLGTENIESNIRRVLDRYESLRLVPEVTVDMLEDRSAFRIEEDRDQHDYVYNMHDLASLNGSALKNRRKKARSFYTRHETNLGVFKANPKQSSTAAIIMNVFEDWAISKDIENNESTQHERIALTRLLDNASSFNLVCIVVTFENNPIGFSLNEVVSKDYAISRFHKSVIGHKHLDPFLSSLVAKELAHYGCKYLSWEQDLGVPGLRDFKESYKPFKYLKKYTISYR
jgi:hypothetical protein